MSTSLSFLELVERGDLGDTTLELRLTARELGALQYLVTVAMNTDGVLADAQRAMSHYGLGKRWNIALRSAQLRTALLMARTFRPDESTDFSVRLAALDQDMASLNGEEDSHGN